jgi:hypothetical protein
VATSHNDPDSNISGRAVVGTKVLIYLPAGDYSKLCGKLQDNKFKLQQFLQYDGKARTGEVYFMVDINSDGLDVTEKAVKIWLTRNSAISMDELLVMPM